MDLLAAADLPLRLKAPSSIREGVAEHRRLDKYFHNHPVFTRNQGAAYQALVENGIGRGPARASAHVGVELLIDGAILSADLAPTFPGLWARLHSPDDAVVNLVEDKHGRLWLDWLARFTQQLDPRRYASPRYVAERLHQHILGSRPRLQLSEGEVVPVTRALTTINDSIVGDLPRLLADLRTQVAAFHGHTVVTTDP